MFLLAHVFFKKSKKYFTKCEIFPSGNLFCNVTYFPGTASTTHWSSTPYIDNSTYAWFDFFYYGGMSFGSKLNDLHTRAVRTNTDIVTYTQDRRYSERSYSDSGSTTYTPPTPFGNWGTFNQSSSLDSDGFSASGSAEAYSTDTGDYWRISEAVFDLTFFLARDTDMSLSGYLSGWADNWGVGSASVNLYSGDNTLPENSLYSIAIYATDMFGEDADVDFSDTLSPGEYRIVAKADPYFVEGDSNYTILATFTADTLSPDIMSVTTNQGPGGTTIPLVNGMCIPLDTTRIIWTVEDPNFPGDGLGWASRLGVEHTYFSYKLTTDTIWQPDQETVLYGNPGFYGQWSWVYPATLIGADGDYDIRLAAVDAGGNRSEAVYQITVDSSDTDEDGVPDCIDNCPAVCNPLQLDADLDGLGDLCDSEPNCGEGCQASCEEACLSP